MFELGGRGYTSTPPACPSDARAPVSLPEIVDDDLLPGPCGPLQHDLGVGAGPRPLPVPNWIATNHSSVDVSHPWA